MVISLDLGYYPNHAYSTKEQTTNRIVGYLSLCARKEYMTPSWTTELRLRYNYWLKIEAMYHHQSRDLKEVCGPLAEGKLS